MNSPDLYTKLKDAYSEQNLNLITSKIIELYKTKQLSKIKGIVNRMESFEDISSDNINKCFSKLIFMYHPDKGHQYRQEIETLYKSGEKDRLHQYTHIFIISDIDHIKIDPHPESATDTDFDIDYAPEYVMDENAEGYEYYNYEYVESDDLKNDISDYANDNTNFSALKRKYYGTLQIDLPLFYLEDIEEIEMANFDINDLSGAEYCKRVVFMNLSNNCITDISQISGFSFLEELYLSDNEIGYVDAMSNLTKLRIADLSNNSIDDLSPLFELPNLEYVNVMGNPVPRNHIEYLKNNNVLVVH